MPFPTETKWVEAAESSLGRSLPSAYRSSMLESNGGKIRAAKDNWNLHPIFDQSDRKRIARTANHILRETASQKEWVGWPDGALAIGANGSGDALIFLRDQNGDFQDAVYAWDHETGNCRLLAADFSKLRL